VKGRWILALSLLAATSLSSVRADSIAFQKKVKETSGLIGYWPFENSFSDLTANANDARPAGKNPTAITFCPGVNGGQGIQIDNPEDQGNFVEVPTPIGSIFDSKNYTILTWARVAKPREPTDDDQWNSLVDRNSLWYMSLNSTTRDNEVVSQFVVRIYDASSPAGGGTPQIRDNDAGPFAKKNEWHQYAMTYEGTKVIAYLDGKQVLEYEYDGEVGPTADTPKEAPKGNYNLTWGAWEQRGDWFTGCFDDTAYFNRAVSADEIKGLYDAMMAKP
jgi:hypothetical protein